MPFFRDGDVYSALRDCHEALKLDRLTIKAHLRIVRCLVELSLLDESLSYLSAFKLAFPDHANSSSCAALESDIARKSKNGEKRNGAKTSTTPPRSSSSSPSGFLRSSENGGGGGDNIGLSSSSSSSSSSLPPTGAASGEKKGGGDRSPPECYDYYRRYCGHCNTTTDIKEANFFGR